MNKLTSEIKRLEQEIEQNRQIAVMQYQQMRNRVADNLSATKKNASFLLMPIFIIGGLLSKKIKRRLTFRAIKPKTAGEGLSLMQKLMAFSSEVTLAIKLFQRVKPVLARLTQKVNPRMTVTH